MLDNPIWYSLTTRQSGLALGGELARRYPADVAPFLGLREESPESLAAMSALAVEGESLYLAGVAPRAFPGWTVEGSAAVVQMVHEGRAVDGVDAGDVSDLGPEDAPAMLALMAEVYPGYFRPRTRELGRYLGIRREGRLVAMAGERMCLTGYREISAVATLPGYRGRGYAGRLVALLVRSILDEGLTPFLHVDADNAAARAAYEKAGFATRREVTVLRLRRIGDAT